jgi:peptide/nickel transport system substrate-binding protein
LLGALPVEQIVDSPFNLQPVGSGPFRFERAMVENDQVTGIVLRRFDEFYGDVPFLDQIIFRYYPDSASAMTAYQEGQVQGISQVSVDVLDRALSEPELAVYTGRKPEQAMVFFNLKSTQAEFLADIEVRKALFMGINRQWIVDRVLNSQAIVADGPVFPGTWAYYEGLKRQDYDPEAARNLLVEAGFLLEEGANVRTREGAELAFTLLYPDDAIHTAVAEALQKYWADLNAQVDLEAVPYDLLVSERLQARDFDAVLVDMNFTRSPDPDPYPFWDSVQATNGQNYTQWNQKVASEYLEQARVTTDLAERARLYRNFQVIFADELPALPLYYPVYNYGVSEDVQGVRMGPLFDSSDRFSTVTQWHLNAVPAAASVETPEPGQ